MPALDVLILYLTELAYSLQFTICTGVKMRQKLRSTSNVANFTILLDVGKTEKLSSLENYSIC